MIRNSSRKTRHLSWRYIRWAIALPTLPMAWWACISHPLTQPVPEPEQQTNMYISVAPIRKLDLVFMVDNSPSMAPKVAKMNLQFPKLIAALKDSDGKYPDLRVALIDSDLGTGGAYASGACGPNDTNGKSIYGDLGNFQMRGASACGMTSSDALWIEYTKGVPVNYDSKKDINDVFACLANNLGTAGCGEEHQLQAFEFALVAQNLHADQNGGKQNQFLRPDAYLGLVFLSDEDDCSAASNDGMFGDKTELKGESASLRCATRGHQCNGQKLADVTPPGYPTTTKFEANFSECSARPATDACPNVTSGGSATDTSNNTACSPLKSVDRIANEIMGLKGQDAADRILVAGIFGWPLKGAEAEKYKIDLTPNPNSADTAHPQIWDYWPVCYDPAHRPKTAGAFDADAWGYGAEGGLRMSAFIDKFGASGLKYSICESDFTDAMKGIGDAIAKKLQNLCVDAKLYNTTWKTNQAPATPDDLGSDCIVAYKVPILDPKTNVYTYQRQPRLPKCDPGYSTSNPPTAGACWRLTIEPMPRTKCPVNGQLIEVLRTAADIAQGPLVEGTKVDMQCRTCTDNASSLSPESESYKACSYPAF
jgi:hypothetical protein